MSMLDGVLGGVVGAGLTKLVSSVIEQNGGLGGLMNKFQAHGLGDVAQSWVSTGPNKPISSQDIDQVLGRDAVTQLAAKIGISPLDVAQKLSHLLPQVVDQMTPGGTIPK